MDGQTRTGYTLSYAEMVEDPNGLYQLDHLQEFNASVEEYRATVGSSVTPRQATTVWTDWMSDQGFGVLELPITVRTRAWRCGLLFSVTPTGGGESRVYAVMVNDCGCGATG